MYLYQRLFWPGSFALAAWDRKFIQGIAKSNWTQIEVNVHLGDPRSVGEAKPAYQEVVG
jgi:hypothetical protein